MRSREGGTALLGDAPEAPASRVRVGTFKHQSLRLHDTQDSIHGLGRDQACPCKFRSRQSPAICQDLQNSQRRKRAFDASLPQLPLKRLRNELLCNPKLIGDEGLRLVGVELLGLVLGHTACHIKDDCLPTPGRSGELAMYQPPDTLTLIQNGVELTFRLKAAGDTNIQMDILPTGKDSKTGVALPPKALIGTAAELDASLEEYLGKYAASVTTIADVVAKADEELQAVEKASSDAARKAVEDKRKTGKSGSAKSSTTTKVKSADSGLIEAAGGDDDDDDEGTTLNTTSTAPASAPAADGAGTGDALSKELFIL